MAATARFKTSPVIAHFNRPLVAGALVTLFASMVLVAYLSPFAYMTVTALKNNDQIILSAKGPILPMSPETYTYEGKSYDVYNVPTDEGVKEWALVDKGRESSSFIDPANPDAGLIEWAGRWRTLEPALSLDPQWNNFADAFQQVQFLRLLRNTLIIAVVGVIGTLISCVLVAYGFARFHIPGKNILFIVLIATIILPKQVTLVPTYAFFNAIGWTNTFLPLIVPHFFANAYNVFLLRQYFRGLPRELDEAAMIDGASPLRVLWSVIIPQSYPALVAVALFHMVFAWNDYFEPLLYLLGSPELHPLSIGIQQFNFIFDSQPNLLQATALMGLALPVILFFLAQRFFMQGIRITGVEK